MAFDDSVLIGGIEKREIKIVDYDLSWPAKFQHNADCIASVLGDEALRIEHIGSTSVPNLAAKPIIDMLLVVENSGDESIYLSQLEAAGYVLRVREPGHRMLRTPERDVHIHVFSTGSPEIDRHLIFRDRLRSNSADRQLYQDAKRRLAAQDWLDMNAYADAKTEIIAEIISRA